MLSTRKTCENRRTNRKTRLSTGPRRHKICKSIDENRTLYLSRQTALTTSTAIWTGFINFLFCAHCSMFIALCSLFHVHCPVFTVLCSLFFVHCSCFYVYIVVTQSQELVKQCYLHSCNHGVLLYMLKQYGFLAKYLNKIFSWLNM